MNPLTTYQGLNLSAYREKLKNKKVVIWGCGPLGWSISLQLHKFSFPKCYFTSNSEQDSQKFSEYLLPIEAIRLALQSKAIILISNSSFSKSIKMQLIQGGLERGRHFLDYYDIPRPELGIDVTGEIGTCSVEKFTSIISKLEDELQHAVNIDIGVFHNPMDHPQINKLIHQCSRHYFTTIKIPSIERKYLRRVANCTAHHIVFEIDDTISKKSILNALNHVNSLREKGLFKIGDFESFVTILINTTSRAKTDFLNEFNESTLHTFTRVRKVLKQITDYSKLLKLLDHNQNPVEHFDDLKWDLLAELTNAKRRSKEKCLCQRIFPVISSDSSVLHCHLYKTPILHDSFLSSSVKKLIEKRSINDHCAHCQSYGLHRLDV